MHGVQADFGCGVEVHRSTGGFGKQLPAEAHAQHGHIGGYCIAQGGIDGAQPRVGLLHVNIHVATQHNQHVVVCGGGHGIAGLQLAHICLHA